KGDTNGISAERGLGDVCRGPGPAEGTRAEISNFGRPAGASVGPRDKARPLRVRTRRETFRGTTGSRGVRRIARARESRQDLAHRLGVRDDRVQSESSAAPDAVPNVHLDVLFKRSAPSGLEHEAFLFKRSAPSGLEHEA